MIGLSFWTERSVVKNLFMRGESSFVRMTRFVNIMGLSFWTQRSEVKNLFLVEILSSGSFVLKQKEPKVQGLETPAKKFFFDLKSPNLSEKSLVHEY